MASMWESRSKIEWESECAMVLEYQWEVEVVSPWELGWERSSK